MFAAVPGTLVNQVLQEITPQSRPVLLVAGSGGHERKDGGKGREDGTVRRERGMQILQVCMCVCV